jgi:hypothetical protein
MRYALSERYCGEVVQSTECSFEDGKRLVLLCPECKKPVFLRGGSFLHFPSRESKPHLCEERVKKYEKQAISILRTEARNRRLLIIEENYHLILDNCPTTEYYSRYWVMNDIESDILSVITDLVPAWRSSITVYIANENFLSLVLNRLKSIVVNWLSVLPYDDRTSIHIQRKLSNIKSKIDLRMHILIYSEFLSYACDEEPEELLLAMIIESMFSTKNNLRVFRLPFDIHQPKHIQLWYGILLDSLLIVPWAEEFLKYSPKLTSASKNRILRG